jgi:hypothetical protein
MPLRIVYEIEADGAAVRVTAAGLNAPALHFTPLSGPAFFAAHRFFIAYSMLMRAARADAKVSADNRGHGLGVAMEEYTHSTPDQKREAVQKIEAIVIEKRLNSMRNTLR